MNNRRVIVNSMIYTFNSMLLKAFSFLLLPLYTAYLSTKDYGVTNLVAGFTNVTYFAVAFSLYAAITRFYVDFKEDKTRVKRFFGTIISFVCLSGTVFFIISCLCRYTLMKWFFKGLNFYPTIFIMLMGITFACLRAVYEYILRSMQWAKKYSIISIFHFFLELILNIYFIVFLKLGADGVILSSLITNVIFVIYMLYDLRKHDLITICIDRKILRESLKYSVPLLPHNLSTQIASFVSKILININFSLGSVGLFSLANQFGSVADIIQSSANMAVQPWFFEQMKMGGKEERENIIHVSDILIWIYGLIFLGIAIFSQEVILCFTPSMYFKAWTVVPMIVISFSIKIMYYFYINILFYYKKATRYIFIATISSNLLNILLSAIFIPIWDMYGSVLGDIVSRLLTVIIIVIISKRFDDIGYKVKKFVILISTNILFIGIGSYLSFTKYTYEVCFENFMYKVIVVGAYMILAGFYLRGDIKSIFVSLKSIRGGNQ